MTDECLRRSAALTAAQQNTVAAAEALEAKLGPDLMRLVEHYVDDVYAKQSEAWVDLLQAELIRHLPGLAPTIRVMLHHIYEGTAADAGVAAPRSR